MPPVLPSGQNRSCIARGHGQLLDLLPVVIFHGSQIWAIYPAISILDQLPTLQQTCHQENTPKGYLSKVNTG